MKTFLLSVACFVTLASQAFAAQPDYKCISEGLQAYNSDIYYNLSKAEIDTMLKDVTSYGHVDATRVSARCDEVAQPAPSRDAKMYKCVADSLEAYNSDMFYNLSKADIDSMLNDSTVYGHSDAVRAARTCSKIR